MAVNVSFIIPHKGREEFLIKTISSILAQETESSQYEILVVSQNKTFEGLSPFIEQGANLTIHPQPENKTISELRNYGVTQASGEYLAFLDADVDLSKNWLTCMLSTIQEKPQRLLVSAAQVNSDNAPPLEKIRTALSNAEIDCEVNFLPGRNLFLSKETFNQVNGFPAHLITCEDYYFTDQVHQLDELYYTSSASYVHLGEDKQYKEMYKKEIWRGQSNLQSIKGRNIPFREIPSFIVPIALFILIIVFMLALLVDKPWLALTSLMLFILPIGIYSIQLHNLAKSEVSFWHVFKFYSFYFPARAIGTLGGLFKSFSNSSIK